MPRESTVMARNKIKKKKGPAFVVFNVHYENGEVTSNRRVASDLLDQSFGESLLDLALNAIKVQDDEIARRSGSRRPKIKSRELVKNP